LEIPNLAFGLQPLEELDNGMPPLLLAVAAIAYSSNGLSRAPKVSRHLGFRTASLLPLERFGFSPAFVETEAFAASCPASLSGVFFGFPVFLFFIWRNDCPNECQ
jgi:hypothetical protein